MFNDSLVHVKYKVTSVWHCLIVINESIKTSRYYQHNILNLMVWLSDSCSSIPSSWTKIIIKVSSPQDTRWSRLRSCQLSAEADKLSSEIHHTEIQHTEIQHTEIQHTEIELKEIQRTEISDLPTYNICFSISGVWMFTFFKISLVRLNLNF